MTKPLFLALSLSALLYVPSAIGQTSFDFESRMPQNIKNTGGNVTLSKEHSKDGAQSLRWDATANSKIEFDLGKTSYYNSIVFLPVYNKKAGNDTLLLQFYTDANKKELLRESKMLLNYKGWREFHRHISFDFGADAKQGGFRVLEITYLPASNQGATSLWLDAINLAAVNSGGVYQKRIPGPHMQPDFEKGYFKNVGNVEDSYINGYFRTQTKPTVPTADELADYKKIKNEFIINEKYIRSNGATTAPMLKYMNKEAVEQAKGKVLSLNIKLNSDGSTSGEPLPLNVFSEPKQLLPIAYNVLALAYGAQNLKDEAAEKLLILYTQHIIDQGIADGGRVFIPTNSYEICRSFLPSFMFAMPAYQKYDKENNTTLSQNVTDMLRWSHTFGQVYGEFEPELTIDFIYLKAHHLFTLADLQPDDASRIRDVKAIKNFYENIVVPQPGASSIIKPDGIGYHHNAQHNAYMYGMSSWINTMHKLRNTKFKVGVNAYEQVAKFATTLYLQTAANKTGGVYGNSLCGRGPFNLAPGINYGHLIKLIEIGGDCMGGKIDPELAAFYNYLSGEKKFDVAEKNYDGFYAFNYGGLGVYRTPGYTVDMRGISASTWGSEIYPTANRFGRYQSYGAVEILYRADDILGASGYPESKTWDWNVIPGTTTVHTSWENLNPVKPRADEVQKSDFSGAVSDGKNGVFALNFIEDAKNYWGGELTRYPANDLSFKKSVFTHNGMLICLGSNISATPAVESDIVATNLFQHALKQEETKETIVSRSSIAENETKEYSLENKPQWILSPAGTGFYLPKQPLTLQIVSGEQTTPMHNASAGKIDVSDTNKAVKGWLRHTPKKEEGYEYIILPKQTKKEMESFAKEANKGHLPYRILLKDKKAHIVTFPDDKTTGYAIFEGGNILPGEVIKSSDPCLIISQVSDNRLTLSISDPTLNRIKDEKHRWISTPRKVIITLKGKWSPAGKEIKNTLTEGNTDIEITLVDGITQQIILNR